MTTHENNLTNDATPDHTGAETVQPHAPVDAHVVAEEHVSTDTVEEIAESHGTIVVGSSPVDVVLTPVTAEGATVEGETSGETVEGETSGETVEGETSGETVEGGDKGDGKGRRSRRGRRRGKGGKNRNRNDRQPRDRSHSLLKEGERFDHGVFEVVDTHHRMPFGTLGRVEIELPAEEGKEPVKVEERGLLPLRGLRLTGANIGRMSESERQAALINRQSSIKLGFAKKLANGLMIAITDEVIAESSPEEREAMVSLGYATKEETAGEEGSEPKIVYKALLTDAEVELVHSKELEVYDGKEEPVAGQYVRVRFPAVMVERASKQGPRLIEVAEYERRERVSRRNAEKAAYDNDKAVLTALAASREPFEVVVQNIGRDKKRDGGGQGAIYGLFCRIPGTERDGLVHVSHVVGGRAAAEKVKEGETKLTVIISQPIKEVERRERKTFQIELSEREAAAAQSTYEPGMIISAQVAGPREQQRVAPGILLTADGREFLIPEDELDRGDREKVLRVRMTRVKIIGEWEADESSTEKKGTIYSDEQGRILVTNKDIKSR